MRARERGERDREKRNDLSYLHLKSIKENVCMCERHCERETRRSELNKMINVSQNCTNSFQESLYIFFLDVMGIVFHNRVSVQFSVKNAFE